MIRPLPPVALPACALVSGLIAALPAAAAPAVTVDACDDFRSNVANVAEPLEKNTRTFANGDIRLVVMDAIEPAAGAIHLVVLHPPYDEVGGRQCHVVSLARGVGFSDIDLGRAKAGYDPAKGLSLTLPVRHYVEESGDFAGARLSVTVNQASGAVTAGWR